MVLSKFCTNSMTYLSIIPYIILLFYSGTSIHKFDDLKKKSSCNEIHQLIFDDLFDSNDILKISIKCDLDEIFNDREEDSNYHDALMEFESSFYVVQLKTRGIFRKKKTNCSIPPIWMKFNKEEMSGSIFSRYLKLKLVLPCYNSNTYEQNIIKEYLIYKIYNLLTDYSFKVRLIQLKIFDLDKNVKPINRYAFFIEPVENLGQRLNGQNLEVKNIHPNLTDNKLTNLMSVFQYMIGNTDWSVKALHNIKLLARDSMQKPVAVPYDFDNAGLVNASYAVPAPHLGIQSVRQRVYNGYYRPMDELQQTLNILRLKKDEIYTLVHSIKVLQKRHIDETIKYFDQFYKTLDHTKRIQYELIDKSRKD